MEEYAENRTGHKQDGTSWTVSYDGYREAEVTSGVRGQALYLGKRAASRKPVAASNPLQLCSGSFTVSFWVLGDVEEGATVSRLCII